MRPRKKNRKGRSEKEFFWQHLRGASNRQDSEKSARSFVGLESGTAIVTTKDGGGVRPWKFR